MPSSDQALRPSGGFRLHEHAFTCPYCWEPISVLLDLSVSEQTYVEDCEVCCRPLDIHYEAERGALVLFEVEPVQ